MGAGGKDREHRSVTTVPGSGPGGEAVVMRWRRSPRCVGRARAALRRTLLGWGLMAVEEASVLVLSELLTNAVLHARVPGREIETRYVRVDGGGGVRIEVHDAAYEQPVPVDAALEDPGGRGLLLVSAVADRWGVSERNGPGKAVWAECSDAPVT